MKNKGVQINVTKEDIKKGKPCDSLSCPIALALIRDLKPLEGVLIAVEGSFCQIWQTKGDGGYHSFILPPIAEEFVQLFDDGESDDEDEDGYKILIEPFHFTIPENSIDEFKKAGLIACM